MLKLTTEGHPSLEKGHALAKTKTRPAKDVEDEIEELDLDEVEDEETEAAPAKGKGKKAAESEVTFGVRDLAEYLSRKTKKTITPRELRSQIRKMAREDKPRVNREILAGNKSRYDWPDGLDDPEVKRIIKAVLGGEIEETKKAALAKLKEQKAAKDAAAGKGTKKKSKAKSKADEDEDEDEDDEVEELDLDEDEE